MKYLKSLGFDTVWYQKCERHPDEDGFPALEQAMHDMTKQIEDGVYPYPADGLVEAYDDTIYASTGSVTRHHATKAGFAFKWQDETSDTTLVGIEWSCAAQCITPVAIFEPVELEGTTVKRASLANVSECKRLGIGGPGTKIQVIKANKIIPKVVGVAEKVGSLVIPDRCPVCGAKTRVEISESGAETLVCLNPSCIAKKLSMFTRFVSKDGMNIVGLSEMTIQQFISMGWIHSFVDFYEELPKHFEELPELSGFGDKSVQGLQNALEASREVSASHFLYALCIPMIGHDVIHRLLMQYSLKQLLHECQQAVADHNEDRFAVIDGIGHEKSKALVTWMEQDENLSELMSLLQEVHVTDFEHEPVLETENLPLSGKVFVITGSLEQFENRKDLKSYIEQLGGKVTGSVTGNTSYLINNDSQSTSSKNKKAKELGVPVITEAEFVEQFGMK